MFFPSKLNLVGLALLLAGTLATARALAQDPLPAGAKGFAGMVAGEVVSVADNQLVLKVTEIAKSWKHSKAENAAALVGKQITVTPPKEGNHAAAVTRFINLLKAGEKVTIDVRHTDGDSFTLLELTKDQRERVKQ